MTNLPLKSIFLNYNLHSTDLQVLHVGPSHSSFAIFAVCGKLKDFNNVDEHTIEILEMDLSLHFGENVAPFYFFDYDNSRHFLSKNKDQFNVNTLLHESKGSLNISVKPIQSERVFLNRNDKVDVHLNLQNFISGHICLSDVE